MLLIRSQGIPCAFTKYLPISHSKCFFIIIITIVQATGSKGAGGEVELQWVSSFYLHKIHRIFRAANSIEIFRVSK